MKYSVLLLALLSGTVSAECYMRSASVSKATAENVHIDTGSVKFTMLPDSDNKRCLVQFRVDVNGQWKNAEGDAVGFKSESDAEVCARAMNMKRAQVLNEVTNKNLSAEQQMVCTDAPQTKVRTSVKIGDLVQESEVNPHPTIKQSFKYMNNQCRWFIENQAQGKDLIQYQGIICRVNGPNWQVVDKF